jgi:predicted enzyme related to lactoylglutathione lyase
MIIGMHAMLYSHDADATRTFCRDALGLASVDAGRGWLIFALPPAELGVHPSDADIKPELFLMCDDVDSTLTQLVNAGAKIVQPLSDQGWGRVVMLKIPGGVPMGLYEPRHPTALGLRPA